MEEMERQISTGRSVDESRAPVLNSDEDKERRKDSERQPGVLITESLHRVYLLLKLFVRSKGTGKSYKRRLK